MAKAKTKKEEPTKEAPVEGSEDMTPEEMETYRKDALKYYQDQGELLESQLKFETLQADVEEQRTRSLMYRVKQAQILAPPPSEEDIPEMNNASIPVDENGNPIPQFAQQPLRPLKQE